MSSKPDKPHKYEAETPEHNVLQTKLLDPNFIRGLLGCAVDEKTYRNCLETQIKYFRNRLNNKSDGYAVRKDVWQNTVLALEQIRDADDFRNMVVKHIVTLSSQFESADWDFRCYPVISWLQKTEQHDECTSMLFQNGIYVDVVPVLGNEYPSFLHREWYKSVGTDALWVVVYDQFVAEKVTEKDVVQMFKTTGIILVSLKDIDAFINTRLG